MNPNSLSIGQLATLRKLAQAATPGSWKAIEWICHAPTTVRAGAVDLTVAETTGHGRHSDACAIDAAFIAAANPAVVLSLLDALDAALGDEGAGAHASASSAHVGVAEVTPAPLCNLSASSLEAQGCKEAAPAEGDPHVNSLFHRMQAAAGIMSGPASTLDDMAGCIIDALQSKSAALATAETAIRHAIDGYYQALDNRQHGGVAQDRAFNAIQMALGMSWDDWRAQKRIQQKGERR